MANVSSNNLTTLYSGSGTSIRPTTSYGNANVERFLSAGTDGANTVTNIVNTGTITSGGNITAPWFIGNVVGNISGNIVVPGSNTEILYNNNGNAGASPDLTFDDSTNILDVNGNVVANYFLGNGSGLSSLTGANVTGQVPYAAVANSVAVGNVAGIGNISVVNLDGSSSNVLYGNGIFAPGGGGNAANANYANFAGTAFSVDVGNVSGIGNIAVINLNGSGSNVLLGNGTWGSLPNTANANYANFAGNAFSVDGSNVVGDVSGANHANISDVANSVAVANVTGIGNIATINLDGNVANILHGDGSFGPESGNLNANYANFAGNAFSVDGSNVVGDVSGANHANISDVANSVAVANVTGIGNIAVLNLDGSSSNVLYGNGVFGPESTTGNANYAAYAGNVTIASQGNITSLGNLISLTVADSNVSNPTTQVIPTGNVVGTALLPNNMIRIDNYNDQGNANGVQGMAFVKSRGNATTPAAAANNDPMMRLNSYVYNGNAYPKAVMIETQATQAANANLQFANTSWTAGAFRVTTGNPVGDVANANASSNQNLLQYNQVGTLSLVTGTNSNGTPAPSIVMIDYGVAANGAGGSKPIIFQRARGNRDSNLALANTDTIGSIGFQAYNGNAFFNARFSQIRANVNTAHGTIANGSSVPADLQFITCSNTTGYTTTFYGNGSALFPGAVSTSGNVTAARFNANTSVSVGSNVSITTSGVSLTQAAFQATNTDLLGGQTPFGFNIFGSSAYQEPMNYYRSQGTPGSPSDCVAGDTVLDQRWQVQANGGTRDLFRVTTQYQGNTGSDVYGLYAFDAVTDQANSTIRFTAGTLDMVGTVYPTNISLNKFNETVSNVGTTSGTITPDLANGSIFEYTLDGDITLNSLGNVVAGSSATIILTQDGTGGHTLTSSMLFSDGFNTLSSSAGAVDIISVFYSGSAYYATLTTGYA